MSGSLCPFQEEFPGESFPSYLWGSAVIIGRDALRKLVQYIPYVPLLQKEDVYTGLLAEAAQIDRVDATNELFVYVWDWHKFDTVLTHKSIQDDTKAFYVNYDRTKWRFKNLWVNIAEANLDEVPENIRRMRSTDQQQEKTLVLHLGTSNTFRV